MATGSLNTITTPGIQTLWRMTLSWGCLRTARVGSGPADSLLAASIRIRRHLPATVFLPKFGPRSLQSLRTPGALSGCPAPVGNSIASTWPPRHCVFLTPPPTATGQEPQSLVPMPRASSGSAPVTVCFDLIPQQEIASDIHAVLPLQRGPATLSWEWNSTDRETFGY